MIKFEAIISDTGGSKNMTGYHYSRVKNFIENLSIDGHTFISCNSISSGNNNYIISTEIIYRENQTRIVLTEKNS